MWDDLDAFILDAFERFAHWFQRLTGKTNNWLSMQATMTCFLVVVTTLILGYRAVAGNSWLTLVAKVSMLGIFGMIVALQIFVIVMSAVLDLVSDKDEESFRRISEGFANPLKNSPKEVKERLGGIIICGLVLSTSTINLLTQHPLYPLLYFTLGLGLANGFSTIKRYFDACDPLPPSTSKIRRWLNSLTFSRFKPSEVASK